MRFLGRPAAATRSALPVFAALALAATAVAPDRADASPVDKVYKPAAVLGETELELRGGYLSDSDPAVNTEQAYVLDLGHGFTPWWFTEAVLGVAKAPGGSPRTDALEWENIFQLTEPGQYFLDYGLFVEIEAPLAGGSPNLIEGGPMFQKQLGRLANTLDVFAEHEFGSGAAHDTTFSYRAETHYLSGTRVEFGAQAFGERDEHVVGPAIFGVQRLSDRNKLKWDAAVLKGVSTDAENFRFRWTLELEFF